MSTIKMLQREYLLCFFVLGIILISIWWHTFFGGKWLEKLSILCIYFIDIVYTFRLNVDGKSFVFVLKSILSASNICHTLYGQLTFKFFLLSMLDFDQIRINVAKNVACIWAKMAEWERNTLQSTTISFR